MFWFCWCWSGSLQKKKMWEIVNVSVYRWYHGNDDCTGRAEFVESGGGGGGGRGCLLMLPSSHDTTGLRYLDGSYLPLTTCTHTLVLTCYVNI